MNIHKHARLTPRGRALLVQRIVEHGLRVEEAAHASGVSVRTAYKWLARYRLLGVDGLQDRSSRPQRCPHATPPELVEQILQQRRQRSTYWQIATHLKVGHSTIARIVRRAGLHRLAELEPRPPVVRYQYPQPGGMLHLDIKRLGRFRQAGHRVTGDRTQASRGAGWEYVHVAIDDHSRVAFSTLHPDEGGFSACRALIAALRYYRSLGVSFQRVLTDNGTCYRSKAFARTLRRLKLRHYRTRPYTPRTNGKAERFIQTALREWAYAHRYDSSEQRAQHLLPWLHHYNWHRPHASLGHQPPISRIHITLNNVVGLHTLHSWFTCKNSSAPRS
ncbi:IS481 family transposase [Xanthomonas melonis]|uniref:IS481 family transposase n=1 Tax=Xanthomonas melonis TaxID=56456 RepID=A0ABS8NSQ0_9XANT|nr:IS481 family transposase [Xanthomonas melonis]MCD0245715.1 IS481 family transposase [Xanthomonas melonis]MCD0257255.1 IS481 family transposase [Xanthomonas melonis]MCD0265459.1 IS481 family transposase [Xanthomonas melonis]